MKYGARFIGPTLMVVASLGLAPEGHAARASANLTHARLASCGPRRCVSVRAERAFVGTWDSNFAFARATVVITDRVGATPTRLEAESVYHDHKSMKIFLRGVGGPTGRDAIYDLAAERLLHF